MDRDYLLALKLQEEFEKVNERSISIINPPQRKQTTPQKANHKTESLVDPLWELIDPTPDIHALFIEFNKRFFWGLLSTVEVRWSRRMTSCAGVCVYQGRSGFCSVRLSLPLLQLRPRKDLIETLLHEMIHAYLFLTKQNRDRDGHGPDFHEHMYRINNDAGTKISVYHSFHDEVRSYQQHWWRCDGPCQKRPPFFGMVRKSMNRAPGPYNYWWAQHQATCGGHFQKIREPEGYGKKQKKQSSQSGKEDIRTFFPGNGPSTSQSPSWKPFQPTNSRIIAPAGNKQGGGMNVPTILKGPTIGSGLPNSQTGYKVPSGSSGNPIPTLSRPLVNKVVGFKDFGHSGSASPVNKPSASAVNNVYGMKDLNGQGTSKPAGKSHTGSFGGRGFTLGGGNSQRPGGWSPAGRGRGGFGGMLANRGGGTLVLTGKPRLQGKDSHNGASMPQPTVSVFSGEGKALGSGDQKGSKITPTPFNRNKLNPFQRNIPVFSGSNHPTPKQSIASPDPIKRSSPVETQGSEKKLKASGVATIVLDDSDDDTVELNEVPCPVCDKKVKEEDINDHLDVCVVESPAHSNPADSVLISDDDDDSEKDHEKVDCPVCTQRVFESELQKHLNSCMVDNFSDDDNFESLEGRKSDVKCPICGEGIKASELDLHLENCAHCSVQDLSQVFEEDFSDDDEEESAVNSPSNQVGQSGERLYPCPCCMALKEESKMNEHLDVCLSS